MLWAQCVTGMAFGSNEAASYEPVNLRSAPG
jgi:hypothetical protein